MNANDISNLRSTMQIHAVSPYVDFRRAFNGTLAVLWKGQERGSVKTETSDRTYHVARDVWGEVTLCVGDTLGEAVLALVPELASIEIDAAS